MRIIPLRVVHPVKLNDDAPSVQSHYRTFGPTTSVSVPVSRIGTLALAKAFRLDFSLGIGTTGSHVPHWSLIQSHAVYVPGAGRAVGRLPSTFIPG